MYWLDLVSTTKKVIVKVQLLLLDQVEWLLSFHFSFTEIRHHQICWYQLFPFYGFSNLQAYNFANSPSFLSTCWTTLSYLINPASIVSPIWNTPDRLITILYYVIRIIISIIFFTLSLQFVCFWYHLLNFFFFFDQLFLLFFLFDSLSLDFLLNFLLFWVLVRLGVLLVHSGTLLPQ